MTNPGSCAWIADCENCLQDITNALGDFVSKMITLGFNKGQIETDVRAILKDILRVSKL